MASVFLTGATGYVGTALRRVLAARGHQVAGLSRGPPNGDDVASMLVG